MLQLVCIILSILYLCGYSVVGIPLAICTLCEVIFDIIWRRINHVA